MTQAYYGLPENVEFCSRCVISNQRPSSTVEFKNTKNTDKDTIAFDQEGVCAACRYADMKQNEIDWNKREQELIELCDQFRSKDGNYDCVVPGSGGKDSSFTAHILKYKYKMNPLTVTWAPHIYTTIGFQNFQNWINAGLDNILFTPNAKVHRLLTRLAFENLCHPFQPFIVGQRHIGPRYSAMYDIPLVFYGENQAEYGNNIDDNFIPTMDKKYFQLDADLSNIYLGGISIEDLMNKHNIARSELNPYLPVDKDKLHAVGTEVHYLGYYIKWDPQECYYYAIEHTGFQVNDQRTEGSYSKYSSIDDKIDPLHYYTTFIKFGLGRASYDAAQEIRNKKITREEGVALVKKFDAEFPSKYFQEILDYMGITEEKFWEVIDTARSPHLWEKCDGQWQLKATVWSQQYAKAQG